MERDTWSSVWEFHRRHAAALRRIADHFGVTDPDDKVMAFCLEQVSRLSAHRDLTSARLDPYVSAAFRNFLRSSLRTEKRHTAALAQLETELIHKQPEQALEVPEDALRDAVAALPSVLSKAAARFLGTSGEPESIRQIASTLQMSRHTARAAVLDGLIGCAIQLGYRGVLSDREVEACRLVLLEGTSFERSSQILGLSIHQVRKALFAARSVVARALAG